MPPRGGGQDGCKKQEHLPPATGLSRDTPPRPTPPSSAIAPVVYQRRKKQKRDEDTPPRPTPPSPAVPLQVYQRRKKRQNAAASIPEGPLMEILSRVPYSSLCSFRCVSRSWLALCSDPDILKASPQTLSGFFHGHTRGNDLKFHNFSGRGPPMVDPALPFLRDDYERFMLEQCCGGLLLCKCWKSCAESDEVDLVVCNPATGEWTVLPPIELVDEEDVNLGRIKPLEAYLGFDPAISDCFVVLVPLLGCLDNVQIYSSKTGEWIQSGWNDGAEPIVTAECVLLNGFMHFTIEDDVIAAVDPVGEGDDWRRIPLPGDMEPGNGTVSMGQSQGLLHAWYIDESEGCQLSVWVLEDYYKSNKWTLKHTVDVLDLFDTECDGTSCEMFAIHPERNLVFITNGEDTTLSYDMDSQEVHVMCTSGEFLGGLPYVPCFADWLSDDE